MSSLDGRSRSPDMQPRGGVETMMLKGIKMIHIKTRTAIIKQTQLHRMFYYAEESLSVIKFVFRFVP